MAFTTEALTQIGIVLLEKTAYLDKIATQTKTRGF